MIDFQMGPEILWSNIGEIILNVEDVLDSNLAPNIDVNSILEIGLDANGNGSKQINCTVTDPEGDPVEIFWEVIDEASVTLNNYTIANPVVTVTNGAASGWFPLCQLRITATDTSTGYTSEKIVDVYTTSYLVEISSASNAPVDDYQLASFYITEGKPLSTAVVKFTLQAVSNSQYAIIDRDEPNERILYGNGSTYLREVTFDSAGDAIIKVKLVNPVANTVVSLTGKIETVADPQFINEAKNQSTESL